MDHSLVRSLQSSLRLVNLIIGGEKGVGKSTLFRHLQKTSSVVKKEASDPLFSTIIHWKNPYSGEMVDVVGVLMPLTRRLRFPI